MEDISREEYERWLRENNVPFYKRVLYNDDPRLVMTAVIRDRNQAKKDREAVAAERARQNEAERRRTPGAGRNTGIYDESGSRGYVSDGEEDGRYYEEDDEDFRRGSRSSGDYSESLWGSSDSSRGHAERARGYDETRGYDRRSADLYDNYGDPDDYADGEGVDFGLDEYGEEAGFRAEKQTSPSPLYSVPSEDDEPAKKATPQPAKKPVVKKKKKKPSDKLSKAGKYIVMAGIAVAVVLIIGISIVNSIDFGTFKLGYVSLGEVTEQGAATAYFARKSEPLYSDATGIFMSELEEGDRVEAGGIVGYIVKEENRNVLARLKQVNAKILALVSLVSESTLLETEIKLTEINAKIKEERARLTEMGLSGTVTGCGEVENAINALITERNALLIESENGNDSILTLKREKEELETVINEKMVPVRSEKAGVVSFHISDDDDAENELYESLAAQSGTLRIASLSNFENANVYSKLNQNVQPEEKICSVISDQNYYVILKITKPVSSLSGLLTVKNSDLTYQAVGNVSEKVLSDDEYVVISTMRGLKNSLKSKTLNVTFDVSKSSGYCVPLTALSDWDKNNTTARLAVVKAGYVQFMYVGIKAWDNEKAIITDSPYDDATIVYKDGSPVPQSKIATITAGTCYVVDSKRVHDGQQIS